MRNQLKGVGIICLVFAVLVVIASSAEMERKSESESESESSLEISKNRACNGTIVDCIGEEELLIGFEGRSLAQNPKYISYGALQKSPICNARIYGNCIDPKSGYKRPCSYYDRCKRGV